MGGTGHSGAKGYGGAAGNGGSGGKIAAELGTDNIIETIGSHLHGIYAVSQAGRGGKGGTGKGSRHEGGDGGHGGTGGDIDFSFDQGTPAEQEKWIVGEFNCSCVGISRCLAAYCKDDTPNACWDDITPEDKGEATRCKDQSRFGRTDYYLERGSNHV